MSKVAVVYWSGTGNTEAMANYVVEGAKKAGAEVDTFSPSNFSADKVKEYKGIAFGCPSMGAEQLEEEEFEPMFNAVKSVLGDTEVGLFGSYGWGGGEWMRTWEADCKEGGLNLSTDSVICCESPNEEAADECRTLGEDLAK